MNISIVIPALNSEDEILWPMKSLEPQLQPADEIIIIDGGSKDRTLEIAEKYGCRIYMYPEATLGECRDFGVQEARNPIILQTDTDVEFPEGFIHRLKQYFEFYPDVVGVAGGWHDGKKRLLGEFTCRVIEGILQYADCIPAYRKTAYYKTQGHPPISFGEQILFWQQLQKVGRTIYDPNLWIWHYSDAQVSIPSYLIGAALLGAGGIYELGVGGEIGYGIMGLGGGFLAGQAGVDILKKIPGVQEFWANPNHFPHHYHIGLMILAAAMTFNQFLSDAIEMGLYGFGAGLALHDILTEPQP